MLNVSDAKQKNFAYFNAITTPMQNGGTAALLHDLQRRDLRGFNPRDFPDTTALNEPGDDGTLNSQAFTAV